LIGLPKLGKSLLVLLGWDRDDSRAAVDAVRRFYERAHEDCRMIYHRLASPKQMQTLVQVWKQL